ncbi:hypothetical protein ACHAXA_009634 [Cyclostephanos tholiformis]|uniref:Uncharacterized protein n=1 Tax=Cyclostephanos tholiformis TaxID=382380 RepID=A0ABD3SEG1_9STRA
MTKDEAHIVFGGFQLIKPSKARKDPELPAPYLYYSDRSLETYNRQRPEDALSPRPPRTANLMVSSPSASVDANADILASDLLRLCGPPSSFVAVDPSQHEDAFAMGHGIAIRLDKAVITEGGRRGPAADDWRAFAIPPVAIVITPLMAPIQTVAASNAFAGWNVQ